MAFQQQKGQVLPEKGGNWTKSLKTEKRDDPSSTCMRDTLSPITAVSPITTPVPWSSSMAFPMRAAEMRKETVRPHVSSDEMVVGQMQLVKSHLIQPGYLDECPLQTPAREGNSGELFALCNPKQIMHHN